MQTVSSIVGPAERSCIVGLKPTKDIVNSEGIIPVSRMQDTVGPLAKTVKDVAHILSIIAEPAFDYCQDLVRPHTGVLRIGVLRKPDDTVDKHRLEAFNDGLARLRSTDAIIIDPVAIPGLEEYESLSDAEKSVVLDTEFKIDLERFLSNLAANPRNIKSLGQLIEGIKHDPSERFPEWNLGMFRSWSGRTVHQSILPPTPRRGKDKCISHLRVALKGLWTRVAVTCSSLPQAHSQSRPSPPWGAHQP